MEILPLPCGAKPTSLGGLPIHQSCNPGFPQLSIAKVTSQSEVLEPPQASNPIFFFTFAPWNISPCTHLRQGQHTDLRVRSLHCYPVICLLGGNLHFWVLRLCRGLSLRICHVFGDILLQKGTGWPQTRFPVLSLFLCDSLPQISYFCTKGLI